MDEKKLALIKNLLYVADVDEVKYVLNQITETDVLYVYAYNYNWDNGFEIPQIILDNPCCDLSVALLLFYRADGFSFLLGEKNNTNPRQWYYFISDLYKMIKDKKYKKSDIEFKVPLTKVQLYKLKKELSEDEYIFVETIEGRSLDFEL